MKREQIEGRWRQLQGQVKQQWAKLTGDDADSHATANGQLQPILQQCLSKEDAELQAQQSVPKSKPEQEHKL